MGLYGVVCSYRALRHPLRQSGGHYIPASVTRTETQHDRSKRLNQAMKTADRPDRKRVSRPAPEPARRSNLTRHVTRAEIVEALGISLATFDRWRRRGIIPPAPLVIGQVQRWPESVIEQALARAQQSAAAAGEGARA